MADETSDLCMSRRLADFFERARPLLPKAAEVEEPDLKLNRERLARFIEHLRTPLSNAEARACTNPWQTAGLGHDEVRASAVLAALWDRRQYGDEGRAFLTRFLARAGSGFPDQAELADGYRVQTEHCLNGAVNDRVDITVETRSSIVGIEVKIYAGEGEGQLSRYVTAIATRARLMGRAKHNVIFLSPYSSRTDSDKVTTVTWRMVGEIAAQADQSSCAGWLIGQFGEYCCSLGS